MRFPAILRNVAAGLLAAAASVAIAAEVGKPAPDFSLTDIHGKTHSLSAYKGRTVVIEWTNPECPIVVKHYDKSGNMPKLQKEATSSGVVWLQVNSGHKGAQGDFAPAEVEEWMKKNGVASTAYVRDQDGKVGKMYDARTTPHMFVVNAEGTLVYAGGIDSIQSGNPADIAKATNYVREALADLKAGQPVRTPSAKPYGCNVKYGKS